MPEFPEGLNRLSLEWRAFSLNDFTLGDRTVSMRRLYQRVLAIKARETYAQVWLSLVTGRHHRHAHNEEYVARLLVLLDDRPIPINPLQRSIGLQLGHLFRTLERAGVDFRAHTSTLSSRIREDYFPWPCQVFVFAEEGLILPGDSMLDLSKELEVFKKDEKRPMRKDDDEWGDEGLLDAHDGHEVEDTILGLLPDAEVVPLPIHPRLRQAVVAPLFRPTPRLFRDDR